MVTFLHSPLKILPLLLIASASAYPAQISGRDRDNILAACAQSHDTCLQSCDAANPANGNIIREADLRVCQDGCSSAYSNCISSVDLRVGVKPGKADGAANKRAVSPN